MSNWKDRLPSKKNLKHVHFMIRFDEETKAWLLKKSAELRVTCNKIIVAIVKEEAMKDAKERSEER